MDVTVMYGLICYTFLGTISAIESLDTVVRLRNGLSNTEGRVEVYYQGEWGTLCGENFSMNEAYVICRQLGFVSVKTIRGFGKNNGFVYFSDLKCTGSENNLFSCGYKHILKTYCREHAGVRCVKNDSSGTSSSSYKAIRLVDGRYPYEGRIEMFNQGQWNTICDDMWDIKDARVACHQLGFASAISSVSRAKFGSGKGTILFTDTRCTGYEKYLNECRHSKYKIHDCSHGEDAGVVCNNKLTKDTLDTDLDYGVLDYVHGGSPLSLFSDSYIYSYDFKSYLESESKPCSIDKCQNDATCIPLSNTTNDCICKYPWSGINCEIPEPLILNPPYNIRNQSEDDGKWTNIFKDINTYIVFGGFAFLLILGVFIVYAIRDIRERRQQLQLEKKPVHV